MMENAIDLIKKLDAAEINGYLHWPLPCELDRDISRLIQLFIAAEPAEREPFYGSYEARNKSFMLLAFSQRMAVLAVREQSEAYLFEGLLAHVIEDFRFDLRENLMKLSLLNHSALKLGVNPKPIFKRAARYAKPEAARHLMQFVNREPELKKIEAMGYKEAMTPEGFSYARSW